MTFGNRVSPALGGLSDEMRDAVHHSEIWFEDCDAKQYFSTPLHSYLAATWVSFASLQKEIMPSKIVIWIKARDYRFRARPMGGPTAGIFAHP